MKLATYADLWEQAVERVEKDENEIKKLVLQQDKEKIYNNSYRLAVLQELDNYMSCFEAEDEALRREVLENMINYEGNVCVHVLSCWLNWRHPECINFFEGEGGNEVITEAFTRYKEVNKVEDLGL